MKKIFLSAGIVIFSFFGCNDDAESLYQEDQLAKVDMSDWYVLAENDNEETDRGTGVTRCASMSVLARQLGENPGLEKRMFDIEQKSRAFIASKKPTNPGGGNGGNDGGGSDSGDDNLGVINIPVIIHILYNSSQQNISDAQIQSQINVLNDDFRAMNNDFGNAPSEFASVADDAEIQFTLSQVIRKYTSRTSFGTNDAIKYNSQGGSDVISPSTHLNIWVGEIGGGILGYAQFPGGSSATDGVVISPQYFGTTGWVSAPFNKGRTATHEVGHWLNLRHIWGDGRCNRDDFVADTPTSDRSNYGCPSYPTANCRSNDMTMNYMDYTNDACMYMFTTGQKERMRAVFASGGPRSSILN